MGLTVTERATRLIPLVAEEFGLSVEELLGRLRYSRLTDGRHALYYVLWRLGMSFTEIGHLVNRDHSTIKYGVNRIEHRPDIQQRVERLIDGRTS